MNDTPPDDHDLTPPGPPADPTPDEAASAAGASRKGGLSLEDWLATQQAVGRSTTPTTFRTPPPVERYNAATSRKMAGWALALSLLFCIPFGFLVATGLAIAVLVRGADGGDHGRGRAIAALVISGLLVILNVVYLVVVLFIGIDTAERDEDGRVIDGGTVTLDKLRVGDCYSSSDIESIPTDGSEGEPVESATVVPCDETHRAEVFHLVEVSGDDFPGEAALERQALDCVPAFRRYVGVPYRRSTLEFLYYPPTSVTWRLGDRTILCSLVMPDYSAMTGSLRDTRK